MDWVEPSPTTGWDFFQYFFGGAPCNDGSGCAFNQVESAEVWQADAYEVLYFQEGVSYTFSHCNGPNAGSWIPEYTIIAPDGSVDAYGAGDGDGCSITWTATQTGTYFIVINGQGICGVDLQQDNGYPALTCNGSPPCPVILDLWVGPYVSASSSETPGSCDGSVEIIVHNGTPPYSFEFSTGETGASNELTELCPGEYWVAVTDSVGNADTTDFIITNFSNVFSNIFGPVGDTLFTQPVQTCDLDYSLPIDSFEVVNAVTAGEDTLLMEWDIWQQVEAYSVSGFYQDLNNDSLVYAMTIFCENGRSALGSFQLFSSYQETNTGILQNTINPIEVVYTNIKGVFIIKGLTNDGVVSVTDLSGRLIQEQIITSANEIRLDLSGHSLGLYVITWTNVNSERSTVKVVN